LGQFFKSRDVDFIQCIGLGFEDSEPLYRRGYWRGLTCRFPLPQGGLKVAQKTPLNQKQCTFQKKFTRFVDQLQAGE